MLLNAYQVETFLETRGKGSRAQVGYDLTLKSVKKINGGVITAEKTTIGDYTEVFPNKTPTDKYIYKLEPGTYSLTFEQGITLDNNHTAFIRHRSSVLRCGGVITSGVFDPGFSVDEIGAVLVVTEVIAIEKGARVAQLLVFQNNESEAYNGQWLGKSDYK